MVRVMDMLALAPKFILDTGAEVSEENLVNYVAVLKEIARIGGVSVEEQKFGEYITSSLGISKDIVSKADRLINEESMSLGELVSRIKEPEYRVCILRDAYIMAMMDDKIDHVEWLALERLAGTLGLSSHTSRKIMNLVDDIIKLQKEFKKLTRQAE